MKKIIFLLIIMQIALFSYAQDVPRERMSRQNGEYKLFEGTYDGEKATFRINTKTGDTDILRVATSEGYKKHGEIGFYCWEQIVNPENIYDDAMLVNTKNCE